MAQATLRATSSVYDNALRHVYTPKLQQLQNRDRILLQKLSRDTRQYAEGKRINIRLHTSGNGGVGYSSSGALPTTGSQGFNEAFANFKRLYGRFEIDAELIRRTRTGYAAEMRALEFEARQLVEDVADALAYDMWGDGSGKLSLTALAAHSTPAAGNFSVPKSNSGLRVGQIIDLEKLDSGLGTDGQVGVKVTSITEHATDATKYDVVTNGTTGDGTWDDVTYFAFRQGSNQDVIDGLQSIIATTGTYLGINRATAGNEFWKAQSMANAGTNRELTLDLMQEMCDRIEKNSPGTPNFIITSHEIWRKLADILVPDKRYDGSAMTLNGWCQALNFRDIPVVRDKYAPKNSMWFMDMDTWKLYQDSEGGFIDEDGQILRQVTGFDTFEAAWRRYLQLVCCDPASNGVINDIAA